MAVADDEREVAPQAKSRADVLQAQRKKRHESAKDEQERRRKRHQAKSDEPGYFLAGVSNLAHDWNLGNLRRLVRKKGWLLDRNGFPPPRHMIDQHNLDHASGVLRGRADDWLARIQAAFDMGCLVVTVTIAPSYPGAGVELPAQHNAERLRVGIAKVWSKVVSQHGVGAHDYVAVLEPHDSGMPHLHSVFALAPWPHILNDLLTALRKEFSRLAVGPVEEVWSHQQLRAALRYMFKPVFPDANYTGDALRFHAWGRANDIGAKFLSRRLTQAEVRMYDSISLAPNKGATPWPPAAGTMPLSSNELLENQKLSKGALAVLQAAAVTGSMAAARSAVVESSRRGSNKITVPEVIGWGPRDDVALKACAAGGMSRAEAARHLGRAKSTVGIHWEKLKLSESSTVASVTPPTVGFTTPTDAASTHDLSAGGSGPGSAVGDHVSEERAPSVIDGLAGS